MNILIFMTDQQRGATSLPGGPAVTPVLDRFRKDAVTFTNAFATSPHCCPSRASFFTGLLPSQHGVWNNVCVQTALSTGLRKGVRCWSEDLSDAGWQCDWNGKWHVSWDDGPDARGFAVHSITAGSRAQGQGIMGLTWEKYRDGVANAPQSSRSEGEIQRSGYGSFTMYGVAEEKFVDTDTITSALDVIRSRQTGKPWCHYIGNLGPHDPYYPPRKFLDWYDSSDIALPPSFADKMLDKPGFYRRTRDRFDQLSDEEHKECIRHYLALCSYEDHLFGQVLEALEQSGEAENTVVIYCSDHGDYMGDHGLWCKGLPAFRGAYEVPLLVRWPGVTVGRGRIENRFVSLTDIAPTILEMAGVQVEREFSGVSLAGLLRGEKCAGWRDAHFTQFHGAELYGIQRSVWTQDWKLVFNGFDYDELYDLRNDPDEIRNLAREPGLDEIRRELYGRLWEFGSRHDDPAINSYIMTGLAGHGPGAAFFP